MQSDGNSFFGYVVLDSFNMAYKGEESILDHIYEKQMYSDFYYDHLKCRWRRLHIYTNTALYNKELIIYWLYATNMSKRIFV